MDSLDFVLALPSRLKTGGGRKSRVGVASFRRLVLLVRLLLMPIVGLPQWTLLVARKLSPLAQPRSLALVHWLRSPGRASFERTLAR